MIYGVRSKIGLFPNVPMNVPALPPSPRDPHSPSHLTGSGILARGALWNMLGHALPLASALLALPLLIHGLGTDRFGVLTLVWAAVGYFGLFDFGLGRALTQAVASRLGHGAREGLSTLVWTALLMMALLGVGFGLLVAASVPWLVGHVLHIPEALQRETAISFYLVAIALPALTTATGLRGILEAHQRFGLINAVRIPLSILSFLGPVAAVSLSPTLPLAVVSVAVLRILDAAILLVLCLRVLPALREPWRIAIRDLQPILQLGGWMTVSNIVGPLMVYFDRFLIAALLTVSAVAFYSTPYDAVTRLWFIPGAVAGVLFPAFATTASSGLVRTASLFRQSVKYAFIALFPVILVIVVFAPEGLALWLGPEFAENSTPVLQILALGVLVNGIAHIAFALVQGLGRADLTAKLHLCEVPFYLLALVWATSTFGIVGVAAVWTLRAVLDALALFGMTSKLLGLDLRVTARDAGIVLGIAAMTAAAAVAPGLAARLVAASAILLIFALGVWHWGLSPAERGALRSMGSLPQRRPARSESAGSAGSS